MNIAPTHNGIELYVRAYIKENSRLSRMVARDASLEEDIVKCIKEKAAGM